MDDLSLIARIKRKDQEAMVTLHARYVDLLYSIAYRVLNEESGAEEAVQDVFMKAWQNADQFDGQRGPVIAWLIGITRNVAIDKLRQRGRQVETTGEHSLEESEELSGFNLPADWQDRERTDGLRFALQDLPAEQRQVIELSYFGGMSQSDIAQYLSLPLGTVKTRMRLGMQKLRDAWLKSE